MMTKTKLTIRLGFHRLQCLKNVSKNILIIEVFFSERRELITGHSVSTLPDLQNETAHSANRHWNYAHENPSFCSIINGKNYCLFYKQLKL